VSNDNPKAGSPGPTENTAIWSNLVRREAFIQGFVAARDPKTPATTLAVLPEAEAAYAVWRASR
jgi:hypothetical protein